jgi:DNA-binding response OmpR family regulator
VRGEKVLNDFFTGLPLRFPQRRVTMFAQLQTDQSAGSVLRGPQVAAAILVIDDDSSLQKLFMTLMKRAGFEVECAADGVEGLEKIRHKWYDVVLLDLMMPRLSGFELLKLLENEKSDVLGRIIITTGVSSRIIETVKATPVYALLRKPFDIDDLISTTRECVAKGQARSLQAS